MNIFFLICIILAILSILSLIVCINQADKDNENASIAFGVFIGLIISLIVIFCITICENPVPAIEVYRGNTELQITYQDSIPIDSVVVYKNK